MKFIDQFRFVRQNMKKNKTRLFMTVLATAMGCTFLIVLASVGFGLQKSIVDDMVGDRMVTAIDIYGIESNNDVDRVIGTNNIEYLRTVDHVKAVTYRNYVQQSLNPKIDGQVVGANAVVNLDFAAESKAGFGLSSGKLPQKPYEVVVGFNIRQKPQQSGTDGETPDEAPPAKEWLGKVMDLEVKQLGEDGKERMMKLPVTIVGISEQPSREWLADSNIYIGNEILTEIEAFTQTQWGALLLKADPNDLQSEQIEQPPGLQDPRQYNQVQAIADGANRVKGIAEEIREKGYMSHSIASELKQVNLVFMIMKIGLGFVGTKVYSIATHGGDQGQPQGKNAGKHDDDGRNRTRPRYRNHESDRSPSFCDSSDIPAREQSHRVARSGYRDGRRLRHLDCRQYRPSDRD